MPRIREYSNQQGVDASPLASAASSAATSAYYAGSAIEEGVTGVRRGLAQAEEHIAQQETSKLAADFATAQAELTTQWNDLAQKADPNDKELSQRFLNEVVQPRLEALGDGLETQAAQNMYQKAAAGLHADMFTKSKADQSALAGQATLLNLVTVRNQLGNSVRADPTSFKSSLTLLDLAIEGAVQGGNLPRDKALELTDDLHKNLAVGAFYGMADKNPQAAKEALASGQFNDYFDATTAKQMDAYADGQIRAANAQAKSDATEKRRLQKEATESVASAISASMVDPQDPTRLRVPADYFSNVMKYAQLPEADDGTVRAMLNAGKTIAEDALKPVPVADDPTTYSDFASRMFLPPGDPRQLTQREVFQATAERRLSAQSFNFFKQAVTKGAVDPQTKAFRKETHDYIVGFKKYIDQSTIMQANGPQWQRWSEFQQDAMEVAENMRASGKTKDEIRKTINDMVPRYQISSKEGLQYMRDQIKGAVPPLPPVRGAVPEMPERLPNESPDAYYKRIHGGK